MNVLGLSTNAFGATENQVTAEIVEFQPNIPDQTMTQIDVSQTTGKASIADADIVVSAGRGLKGPENWGIIEEMAEVLGAATACSKPVSDMGWRPHSEHVGQTGKPVATNLYFAIGISGAIQHLAGINASKIKVVINTDPEAPFFKAADYGIVGDAFDVVPRLTEKLKALQIGSV
jgi:electron transfer flavoprotein alpha subunit